MTKQRLLVRYTVEDTETGNVFDSFKDLNKAIEWVKELVLEDIQSGTYEEDYHSIYKEENGEKELLFVDSDIISKEEEIFRFNLKEFEALIGEKVLLSELIDKINSDYDYPDEERLSSREALIEEEFLQFNIHPKFFYKDDLPLHYITIGFTVSEIYDYESEEDDAEIVINEITYDYY